MSLSKTYSSYLVGSSGPGGGVDVRVTTPTGLRIHKSKGDKATMNANFYTLPPVGDMGKGSSPYVPDVVTDAISSLSHLLEYHIEKCQYFKSLPPKVLNGTWTASDWSHRAGSMEGGIVEKRASITHEDARLQATKSCLSLALHHIATTDRSDVLPEKIAGPLLKSCWLGVPGTTSQVESCSLYGLHSLKTSTLSGMRVGYKYASKISCPGSDAEYDATYGESLGTGKFKGSKYYPRTQKHCDNNAQLTLALSYLHGIPGDVKLGEVKFDWYRAKRYVEEAADSGNMEAMYILGMMYLGYNKPKRQRKVTPDDEITSQTCFLISATAGYPKAAVRAGLGFMKTKDSTDLIYAKSLLRSVMYRSEDVKYVARRASIVDAAIESGMHDAYNGGGGDDDDDEVSGSAKKNYQELSLLYNHILSSSGNEAASRKLGEMYESSELYELAKTFYLRSASEGNWNSRLKVRCCLLHASLFVFVCFCFCFCFCLFLLLFFIF